MAENRRPVYLLLTGDLALAARLQGQFDARLGGRVLWCASLRDVREHLRSHDPVALLVEVPRRSARMLQVLKALAQVRPVLAITRPQDEVLAGRCLAAGATCAVPRLESAEEVLLGHAADLAARARTLCGAI